MSRWSYLITRIIILGLIVCALCIGIDPLVRRALIASAENSLGTNIEIGQVRTSIRNGKVYLKDLRIIDPRDESRNLLQADLAYLEIDPQRLMHRQFVIDQASASKLVFSAPRTTTVEPIASPKVNEDSVELQEAQLAQRINKLGVHWLDQFSYRETRPANSMLGQKASKIRERWNNKIELTTNKIFQLQNQLKVVTVNLNTEFPNPLRDKLSDADKQVKSLNSEIAALTLELADLQQQRVEDRQAILEAANYDVSQIPTASRFATEMDGDLISQLLLTRSNSKHTNEIVNWFRWFRNAIPDAETDLVAKSQRGEDIAFGRQDKSPEFLIKTLEMAGEGHFAGNHFNFSGKAHNITTQPSRHDLPTTFNLRAQGKHHVIVDCTLDRRADQWLDSINVHCPNLELDQINLGEPNSVLVSMSPSRLETNISITANGEELSGEIVYQYSDVQLLVEKLDEMAGGKETAIRLNSNLSSINSFRSVVTISGSPDEPDVTVSSDLGPRFTAALESVITTQQKKTRQFASDQIDAAKKAELHWIDGEILLQLNHLTDQLKNQTESVARLTKSLKDSNNTRRF